MTCPSAAPQPVATSSCPTEPPKPTWTTDTAGNIIDVGSGRIIRPATFATPSPGSEGQYGFTPGAPPNWASNPQGYQLLQQQSLQAQQLRRQVALAQLNAANALLTRPISTNNLQYGNTNQYNIHGLNTRQETRGAAFLAADALQDIYGPEVNTRTAADIFTGRQEYVWKYELSHGVTQKQLGITNSQMRQMGFNVPQEMREPTGAIYGFSMGAPSVNYGFGSSPNQYGVLIPNQTPASAFSSSPITGNRPSIFYDTGVPALRRPFVSATVPKEFGPPQTIKSDSSSSAVNLQIATMTGAKGGVNPVMALPDLTFPDLISPISQFLIGASETYQRGVSNMVAVSPTNPFIGGLASVNQGALSVGSAMYKQGYYPAEYQRLSTELEIKGQQFESRWKPFISGDRFTGTEAQFGQYQADYGNLLNLESRAAAAHREIPSVQFEQMLNNRNFGGYQGDKPPAAWGAMQEIEGKISGVNEYLTKNIPYVGSTVGAFVTGVGSAISLGAQIPVAAEMASREFGMGEWFPAALARRTLKNPAETPGFIARAAGNMAGMSGLHVAHGSSVLAEGIWTGFQTKPLETGAMLVGAYVSMPAMARGAKFANEASPFKITRFDIPTERVWDQELNNYGYKWSSYTGITLDRSPWVRIPLSEKYLGAPYEGKSAVLGFRTGNAGIGISLGRNAPAKLFAEARPVPGEYNLVDTKTIPRPFNVPIAAEAFRPHITLQASETIQAIMDFRDVVSSRHFTATPRQEYGAIKPSTMSDAAWNRVTDYVSQHPADFNLYGSTVGAAYLGPYGRATLGDLDALINTKGSTAPRTHAENLFREVVKTDYPEAQIVRREFKNKAGEPDYALTAMVKGKPIIELKVEKSVLTGTRYSGRMLSDYGMNKSGELVLDLHPHKLGSGGEWLQIEGIKAKTMGYSSIVWGKATMGYGKISIPEKGLGTIGFDRIKDVVDLSLLSRDTAARLYEPTAIGKWDIKRTGLAMKAERASDIFSRDVFAFDEKGEGANLFGEARNPLLSSEGRINRSGAILDYESESGRLADQPMRGESGILFPKEGGVRLHPEEAKMWQEMRSAEDRGVDIPEDIFVWDTKNRKVIISKTREIGSVDSEIMGRRWVNTEGVTHTHPIYQNGELEPVYYVGRIGAKLANLPIIRRYVSQYGPKTIRIKAGYPVVASHAPIHMGDFAALIVKDKAKVHGVITSGGLEVGILKELPEESQLGTIYEYYKNANTRIWDAALKEKLKGVGLFDFQRRAEIHYETYAKAVRQTMPEVYRMAGGRLERYAIEDVLPKPEEIIPGNTEYSVYQMYRPGEYSDLSSVGYLNAGMTDYVIPDRASSFYPRAPLGSRGSIFTEGSGSAHAAPYGGSFVPSDYTSITTGSQYGGSNYDQYEYGGYSVSDLPYSGEPGYGYKPYGSKPYSIPTPKTYGSYGGSKYRIYGNPPQGKYGGTTPATGYSLPSPRQNKYGVSPLSKTTYGINIGTYGGSFPNTTVKIPKPNSPVIRGPSSPVLWTPKVPLPTITFPWPEQKRGTKRKRRRDVVVSKWKIQNPVPRLHDPWGGKYLVNKSPFGLKYSKRTYDIVEPEGTTKIFRLPRLRIK